MNKGTMDIGGNKQPSQNGRINVQTIELYNTIQLQNNYSATHYVFGENSTEYSIQVALNNSNEFSELRRHALKWKIKSICISFNYNRVPNNGEKFAKMLITPETDMVLTATDPLINKNTMVWDMTHNGNKNYNFYITPANTEKINQEWQIGDSLWNAIMVLHITEQGKIQYNFDQDLINEAPVQLGEVKVSIRVVYVPNDITYGQNKSVIRQLTASEVIQKLKLQETKDKRKYDIKGNLINEHEEHDELNKII